MVPSDISNNVATFAAIVPHIYAMARCFLQPHRIDARLTGIFTRCSHQYERTGGGV
jgi:hypothetical protein